MQCYICVTYMIILCSARPPKPTENIGTHAQRSLFSDVIESLGIHSHSSDDSNQNDENNLSQNFIRYGYSNEQQFPNDAEFIPRRNDRIAMPSLKYRFPKSLSNDSVETSTEKVTEKAKEEIVIYITTTKEPKTTTQKLKKKTLKPGHKNTIKKKDNEEVTEETETKPPVGYLPMTNTMGGQSQIGNRESQIVLKPTVIVNVRGTVGNRENDIKLSRKSDNITNESREREHPNIFNINQEIKLDRTIGEMDRKGPRYQNKIQQDIRVAPKDMKIEEDMMMCETGKVIPEKNIRESRRTGNLFQISFSV